MFKLKMSYEYLYLGSMKAESNIILNKLLELVLTRTEIFFGVKR